MKISCKPAKICSHAGSIQWYNRGRNAPAARTVAERPSSVTRRSRVWRSASSKIGPQVTSASFFPCFPSQNEMVCVGAERFHARLQFRDNTR